jgi:hypothetical protein
MSNILIAGDSWGVGVYESSGENYAPTGEGIHSILSAQEHTVTNISKSGASNGLMLDRLNGLWHDTGRCLFGVDPNAKIDINFNNIDYIIFLQTDIFRERSYYDKQCPTDTTTQWRVLEQSFVNQLLEYNSLDHIFDSYFTTFYTELNNIGLKHNKKILMLGCWSQLHPSVNNYSNLIPVVDSVTKFLLPNLVDDVYISDTEWYTQLADNQKFMQKFGDEFKLLAIAGANKIDLMCHNWNDIHPNLAGYEILAKKITNYLL